MIETQTTSNEKQGVLWPTRKEGIWRDLAWRAYRVRDERKQRHHVLAVGVQEAGEPGRERIDLVAYLIDTRRFGDWKAREEVCSMSAHRSFGLKLTNGFVIVEQESLRGLHIGSLCFNEIVKWARRVAPDDTVHPIKLLASHENVYGVANLERRYRFYKQFGLEFDLNEEGQSALASGESRSIIGRDLIAHSVSKHANIEEIDLVPTLQRSAMQQEELEDDVKRLETALKEMQSERRRRHNLIMQTARVLSWPAIIVAFAAGAILARPGHFGLHF